jgi:predicted metal-dependent peptidase
MTQIAYQEESNIVQFPSSGRSLLRQAIEQYEKELNQIENIAASNTWMVDVPKLGLVRRTKLESGKTIQKKLTLTEVAEFRKAMERRDRKAELTVLIDELSRSLHRGL